MAFLSDLGLDQIDGAAVDYSIANGTYPAMVFDSKIMSPASDPNKSLWQITYKLDNEVETFGGRTVSEFFDLDPSLSADRKVWIKRRLVSLGVPADEIPTMDPGDILGTQVIVTVKNRQVQNKTYTNVTKVTLDDGSSSTGFAANF